MKPQKLSHKKTILVFPIDCVGHVNACLGSMAPLLARGHRIIFLLEESFRGKAASTFGFEEHVYSLQVDKTDTGQKSWGNGLLECGVLGPELNVEQKYRKILDLWNLSPAAFDLIRQNDQIVKRAIDLFEPDLIVLDSPYLLPGIYFSGIPWLDNMSIQVLAYACHDMEELPPSGSGYPSNAPRDQAWFRFKELNNEFKYSKQYNDFIEHDLGYGKRFPRDLVMPMEDALLTVYACPQEINWDAVQRKVNWFNIEVFNLNESSETESLSLEKLVGTDFWSEDFDGEWSGKWVYLSMGTMGSVDLRLMVRLMDAVGDTKHKFIVSMGPRSEDIVLPGNAWGDAFLPQTQIVPQMDAVISHGGNNTTTETFAQGKPMMVMALFGDQYDNAQRIHETGYGIRLEPYHFTKREFSGALDKLLYDRELREKCWKASKRMASSKRHEELADRIEQLLRDRENYVDDETIN